MGVRLLIVDDSEPFLEAASLLLEREGLTVAGVASSSGAAIRQIESLEPEVVLVDVFLGEESGFELARRLADREDDHGPAVIMISTHDADDLEDLLAASPAAGFVSKAQLSANAILGIISGRRDT